MNRAGYHVCAVLSIALSGCIVAEDDLDISMMSQAETSTNRLSLNRLSLNRLSLNRLSLNRLSLASLGSGPARLDQSRSNGMEHTEDGREVLEYLVKCALEDDDILVVESAGVTYIFSGLLGLAPEWMYRAPKKSQVIAVSGCLLAHGNHFGVSVPISVRMGERVPASEDERNRFVRYEAAFFGNVFSRYQPMYACWGDSPPDFSLSYPDHDAEDGDRLLRRCADEDPERPGDTMCGLTYLGPCSDVCDTQNKKSYLECWTDKERTDTMYRDVMSVWLLSYDDSSSVWSEHYDEVYGP